MKYIVLVADGMADYPIKSLEERTPLEAARTPNFDLIARDGMLGRVKTIPENRKSELRIRDHRHQKQSGARFGFHIQKRQKVVYPQIHFKIKKRKLTFPQKFRQF